jgi:hypothetical protein
MLLPKTRIETDSYVAVQMLEKLGEISLGSLAEISENLEGSFTITVLTRDGLYMSKGNNPLCVYRFPKLGAYVYASTEELLRHGLYKTALDGMKYEETDIAQGEVMKIDTYGKITKTLFENPDLLQDDWHYYGYKGESYMELVLEYAGLLGFSEHELALLLDAGFDATDLEEMLYDDDLRKQCVNDVLCGYC